MQECVGKKEKKQASRAEVASSHRPVCKGRQPHAGHPWGGEAGLEGGSWRGGGGEASLGRVK